MTQTRPRRVSVLGSTGSVGVNTVALIEFHNARMPGRFEVVSLTANANVAELAAQARRLRPAFVAIGQTDRLDDLRAALSGTGIACGAGSAALEEAAARDTDWVMASIMGAAGLKPTLAAIAPGRTIALANKECLVSAGELFMRTIRETGATLLPVDSEHNAVFQVFEGERAAQIESVVLTASGGPFRNWTREQILAATPAQACKHPNYAMGAKISVDSATLMNKGLELIEASHIFGTGHERLGVLVHPQQVVHCLVSYVDGSVLAQLASPDMRTPIAYALGYPERIDAPTARLDLATLGNLSFEKPDLARFPCLGLAQDALRQMGAAPTILNAANEIAVEAFLAGKAGFGDIERVVGLTMERCDTAGRAPGSIGEALEIDAMARHRARSVLLQ